ncbi:MAG TPA: helix-turn-helix transcriptional regulator [Solirubrobacterales bacterium]|nr:helix-turn-helix transcriptional regulator [Solirubrobacterales bacterium]
MSTDRLTGTSYAVLGLLDAVGHEVTPYDLKQLAQISVFHFWSVPHTQIYTECERLAEAELLSERREDSGRRRRFYSLTERGREELERWRREPTTDVYEAREPGALKLFFGADPGLLAAAQLTAHEAKLEELRAGLETYEMTPGMRLAAELGLNQEEALVRFWSDLLARENGEG